MCMCSVCVRLLCTGAAHSWAVAAGSVGSRCAADRRAGKVLLPGDHSTSAGE